MFSAAPTDLVIDDQFGATPGAALSTSILLFKPVARSRADNRDHECRLDSSLRRFVNDHDVLAPLLRDHGLILQESVRLVEGSRFVVSLEPQRDHIGPVGLEDRLDATMNTLRRVISVVRASNPEGEKLSEAARRMLAHLAATRHQLIWPGRSVSVEALDLLELQHTTGKAPPDVTLTGIVRGIDQANQRITLCAARAVEGIRTDDLKVGGYVEIPCRYSGIEKVAVFIALDRTRTQQAQFNFVP